MLRTLALLSALLCSSLAQDTDLSARFEYFRQLSASPAYDLYWNASGTTIVFAVRVETEGWVGFGISPNGLMIRSDVVMGHVDDTTGVVAFIDRRTDPIVRKEPAIDAQQDWNLVSGSQVGGFTTLEFFRLLDTGDTAGDLIIGEAVNLIWSFRLDDNTQATHSTRGAVLGVNLLQPKDICNITCDSALVVEFGTCTCQCQPGRFPRSEKCPPPLRFSNTSCFCECPPDLVQECLPNQVYNNFTCSCDCDEMLNCTRMYTFDMDICACVCDSTSFSCPSMHTIDLDLCECVCDSSFSCPDGRRLDTSSCQCVCDSVTCPPGQMFADSTCECVNGSSSSCPQYMHSLLYVHMSVIFNILIICLLYT